MHDLTKPENATPLLFSSSLLAHTRTMPSVSVFDTQSVHPQSTPLLDTFATIKFQSPFVDPPRLPNGFSELDIDSSANIRAKSVIDKITKESAEYHITTWEDSKIRTGIINSLDLAPADMDFLTGEHMRDLLADPNAPNTTRITFERPFKTPPKVVTFFNWIDFDNNMNYRLNTSAIDIDTKGFTLVINTWSDTLLNAAQAGWIAYPEDREHIFSASVNTQVVYPWDSPQPTQSKSITFGDVEFCEAPKVFVALNEFDIGAGHDFRLKAYVEDVTKSGLTWHIDTWDNSVLFSAGATLIAIN